MRQTTFHLQQSQILTQAGSRSSLFSPRVSLDNKTASHRTLQTWKAVNTKGEGLELAPRNLFGSNV
jgi:hypothetical protein